MNSAGRAAAPTAVRFEHRTDDGPVLAVNTAAPRLSWHVPQADPGYTQRAYEIELRRAGRTDRVQVKSAEQVLVPWPGRPLESRERAEVRVRVRGDAWSDWSEPAMVEAGLLRPEDWSARFISPRRTGLDGAAPVLRAQLEVPGDVVRARLYATAHGVYTAQLNGERVGDQVLAPGWTSYHHRLRYQAYDVTDLIRAGTNLLAVTVGNGWYRGRLGYRGERARYGERLALLAQLEVTTVDGTTHVLSTDGTWHVTDSRIVANDLYDGQHTDLRRRIATVQGGVEVIDADLGRLVAPDGPPVRVTGTRAAGKVWQSPAGRTLVDFGQNIVGWVRLRVPDDRAGRHIVIRHAEVLEDGELGVRPLRTAKATDTYTLGGTGDEVLLEPSMTFHGFRYAEVTGVDDLQPGDVEAVVVGSDLPRTGWFRSSDPLLNQLHDNVVWSMRGNFLDVPTDCPQRDERLGWTGDLQVFAPTALFLSDSAGFLTSWLADLAADQRPNGAVPYVVPDVLDDENPAAAAWSDAATIVPWVLYQRTGDTALLARQFPSMRAWLDRVVALTGPDGLWTGGFQWGDWLDPSAPPDRSADAKADPDVVATAHLIHSADIVAEAAAVLGDTDAHRQYAELAARTREAFARAYVTASGRVISDAPTAYALALQWGLLPAAEQQRNAGQHLADLVRTAGFRISTGFVGTPLMTDALADAGEPGLAYRLLLQTGCPSWLYPVTMGATTIWERWDSMLPDGSINPGKMTSFNHYALGAVADWLHRRVAGLAPAAPGYREIVVRPIPHADLHAASAAHLTPYGRAEVGWERGDGTFRLTVTIPVGATATVHLPGTGDPVRVGHGRHDWTVADPHRQPPGLPAEPTIRNLFDHESTWREVVGAVVEAGRAADEPAVARMLRPYLDGPATALVRIVTGGRILPGADRLRHRIDALLR